MPVTRKSSGSQGGTLTPSFSRSSLSDQILLDCPEVYYKFDETSGDQCIDYSGFNRHGVYGASAQLNQPAIGQSPRSVKYPAMGFNFPVVVKKDGNGNPSQKNDFSAVCLVRITSANSSGIIFNAGNNSSGVSLGQGYGGNPGQNGNVITSLANYEAYLDPNTQFVAGVNLLGLTVRARDNFIVVYLNGLPVYSVTQVFRALVGEGTVGLTSAGAFPAASCHYGVFAFYQCELPSVRMAAYWKALQLVSLA